MKESEKIKILVNMLVPEAVGYDGKSGGENRFLEILKRWNSIEGVRLNVIAPKYKEIYFKQNGIVADFKVIKTNLKFKNLGGLCLKALYLIVKTLFVFGVPKTEDKNTKLVVYASSDLFWEVIPAFFYKLRNKNIEWVQLIMHLYPDWKKRPGSRIVSFFGYYLQKFSHFLIKRKADKIILINTLVRDELAEKGFDGKKMYVQSIGIEFEYLDKLNPAAVSYDGVFLGRLNASKGVADFIPIWRKVCKKIPAARLAIIGGAEKGAKEDFVREIKAAGLEKNIEVLGFLEDEKAFSLLKAGKVFIFPSHEEGWGIAIAQACACGLPVVSWNLPVFQEIFENYTLQVKENHVAIFAEKVIELLKNDELRKKIGDSGREFVKKYSWEEVARKELEIIKV